MPYHIKVNDDLQDQSNYPWMGETLYLLTDDNGNVLDSHFASSSEEAKRYFLEFNPTLDEFDIED
ncbi:MAG: hypothetical protein J6Y02_01215 [Pseudobutyrivibrio sp.]|nr:hypothetical protein [Pseudobutyrivibrio sp.]